MNQAFLEALKAQETVLRSAGEAPVLPTKPRITTTPAAPTAPATPATPATPANSIRLEIVVNRNRLDLFFDSIPYPMLREVMKRSGWRYSADPVKKWYNADTEQNREFLRSTFRMALEPKIIEFKADPSPSDTPTLYPATPQKIETPIEIVPVPDTEISPEFARYRAQVNELLEYLKCEPADLMLMAIEHMYKATFSRPN